MELFREFSAAHALLALLAILVFIPRARRLAHRGVDGVFRSEVELSQWEKIWHGSIPLFLFLGYYSWMVHGRQAINPDDMTLPSLSQIWEAFRIWAFERDPREGYKLLADLKESMGTLGTVLAWVALAPFAGVVVGVFPRLSAAFVPICLYIEKLNPLAMVAALFAFTGIGNEMRVFVITFAVFPTVMLDAVLTVQGLPRQQFDKARSLAASEFELAFIIALPQVIPRTLDTIRLNFKALLMVLVASERIGTNAGFGYRIVMAERNYENDMIFAVALFLLIISATGDGVFQFARRNGSSWDLVQSK